MIIIAGWVKVPSAERETYLEERKQKIQWVRTRPGCVEYTLSADPLEDDKVRVFEVWDSPAAQRAKERDEEQREPAPAYTVRVGDRSIVDYEVVGSQAHQPA